MLTRPFTALRPSGTHSIARCLTYKANNQSAEAAGPGELGLNSGPLHLILLPAVRKFGTTRFPPFILPAFSALPPRRPLVLLLFLGCVLVAPLCCPPSPPPAPPLPPRPFLGQSPSPPLSLAPLPPTSASARILSPCWFLASRGGRRSVKFTYLLVHIQYIL